MAKKVLVLEDESSIRGFIVINLTRAGYEVIEAESGEEALEKLKELVKGTLKMQKDSYWGYPFLPEMNYFKGQEGYDVAQFP